MTVDSRRRERAYHGTGRRDVEVRFRKGSRNDVGRLAWYVPSSSFAFDRSWSEFIGGFNVICRVQNCGVVLYVPSRRGGRWSHKIGD